MILGKFLKQAVTWHDKAPPIGMATARLYLTLFDSV